MKKNKSCEMSTLLSGEAFSVKKQRWGTFISVDNSGNNLVTSFTEESCIAATHFLLKCKQEGFTDDAPTYSGKVDGKL